MEQEGTGNTDDGGPTLGNVNSADAGSRPPYSALGGEKQPPKSWGRVAGFKTRGKKPGGGVHPEAGMRSLNEKLGWTLLVTGNRGRGGHNYQRLKCTSSGVMRARVFGGTWGDHFVRRERQKGRDEKEG